MTDSSFDLFAKTNDAVSARVILRQVGTPVYVYSSNVIRRRYNEFDNAFLDYPHRVHYALKANSTLAIARLVNKLGSGADVNSGGELEVALRAGFQPQDIVFTGVGKSKLELERAVSLGLQAINAESLGELERIDRLALAQGKQARVALRVNPDVEAGGYPQISTGKRFHKFGVPIGLAREVCQRVNKYQGLIVVGLHIHIGSQIVELNPLRSAAKAIVSLARELSDDGIQLEHLDLGGGLGISYDGSETSSVSAYASALIDAVSLTQLSLLVEPGRWIVGPAGVLLTSVVDVKNQAGDRFFVVLDAGMSEFLRPALYGATHRVRLLGQNLNNVVTCDLVGPLCETSDIVAMGERMPLPKVGDLIAIFDAGAYGSAMASNYNRHPLPAEVMVDGDDWEIIRRRQSFDDLVYLET